MTRHKYKTFKLINVKCWSIYWNVYPVETRAVVLRHCQQIEGRAEHAARQDTADLLLHGMQQPQYTGEHGLVREKPKHTHTPGCETFRGLEALRISLRAIKLTNKQSLYAKQIAEGGVCWCSKLNVLFLTWHMYTKCTQTRRVAAKAGYSSLRFPRWKTWRWWRHRDTKHSIMELRMFLLTQGQSTNLAPPCADTSYLYWFYTYAVHWDLLHRLKATAIFLDESQSGREKLSSCSSGVIHSQHPPWRTD